jgi:basic membrane protein A
MSLVIKYLSNEPGGGFQLADTTALRIFEEVRKPNNSVCLVPVCGGAMNAFFRILPDNTFYMSIDDYIYLRQCHNFVNVIKNIDTVLDDYLGKWEIGTMPKHQTLGLDDGGTDLYFLWGGDWFSGDINVDSLRQVAIRKEGERYGK